MLFGYIASAFTYTLLLDFETDYREWRTWRLYKVTGQDLFFRVHCTSFHNYSPLLTFFLCFIVLFQSCCSHAQVFGKTLLHEFPIFYSHTEWNLLSSGTNTILWWRACYKTTKRHTHNTLLLTTVEITPNTLSITVDNDRWQSKRSYLLFSYFSFYLLTNRHLLPLKSKWFLLVWNFGQYYIYKKNELKNKIRLLEKQHR